MSVAPHLLLRADADLNMGNGHIMRCLALASAWRRLGGQATLLTSANNEALLSRIESEGHQLLRLGFARPNPQDIETTVSVLKRLQARYLALDGYQFDARFHAAIRLAGYPLLVIDDNAHLPYYDADAVLNQNLHAPQLNYRCASGCRLLLGPSYTLLRSEFTAHVAPHRAIPSIARRILVTMGGADAPNVTAKIIAAINELARQATAASDSDSNLFSKSSVQARIVIGPANPHRPGLEALLRSSLADIQLITISNSSSNRTQQRHAPDLQARDESDARRNPASKIQNPKSKIQNHTMPDLMSWADLAVSAGGSTCWELAFMGVPTVVIVTADNQVQIAGSIQAHGSALNLGWHCDLTPADIAAALCSLIADRNRRKLMSELGHLLVDGRGAERVSNVLMSGSDPFPANAAISNANSNAIADES